MAADKPELEEWLRSFMREHQGVAGTIHALQSGELELAAAVNIPPKVIEVTRRIPFGKGMAGLAWERNAPVSTCNLKTDTSGDVRPGANAVDANAAVALPVHDASGAVRGVVGVAFLGERELSEEELSQLEREAERAPI